MELSFKNRAIIITGATSGIGEATAEAFSQYNCQIMVTGRNEEKLTSLKTSQNSHKAQLDIFAGDITDANFRKQLVQETIHRFGKLDILVNSAGIIASGTIETVSLENYDRMMDINLRSIFHLIQLVVPYLETTNGNIVNVSSVAGLRAFPGIFSYCISKAGLDQLTRCAALELASKGIRVNAVNPGVVETHLHKNSGMSAEEYQRFLEHSQTTHPLGRVGQSKEVAELILFLASDAANWITGTTYSIDGGRAQTCAR